MKINISRTEANVAAVEAALAAVNGKAEAFTITSWWAVSEVAKEAEERLRVAGIPKEARKGAKVFHTPAGPTATAYRYPVASTEIEITRGASGWYLTFVRRVTIYPCRTAETHTLISPEQRAIIIDHALDPFRVVAPEVAA